MQKSGNKEVLWHPFASEQEMLAIVRAEGTRLYTEEGKSYIDAISSWWVNLHGHGHPYIAERIAQQARTLAHVLFAGCTHPPALELAEKLLAILPGNLQRIFYSDNGSTAVETALKIVLQYWYNQGLKKTKIISFREGYHGDTFGAMSVSGRSIFSQPFWDHLFEVESIPAPLPGKERTSYEEMSRALCKKDAAAFLFEPLICGASGMKIYEAKALDPLLQACREEGVLLIADEVMTGFGRTGSLFASERLSISPDIVCLSKGITGGFLPLGATACTEQIYEAFSSKALLHGHTYTANPIACAASLASLDLLLGDGCKKQRAMIREENRLFCEKLALHPKLLRCETLGTILVLEYFGHTSYLHPLKEKLVRFFLERDILIRPLGNILYLMPPYCISKEELHHIYETIIGSLHDLL